MSKFNSNNVRARAGESFIKGVEELGANFNSGIGQAKDAKSELFLAMVSDFGGENTFYESASVRSARLAKLTSEVAIADPEWITNFALWLRNEANMRSASLILALESAKALIKANIPGARKVISNAISRADEPGEALGWWYSNVGRKLPAAVKRGIADGAVKTYNEYSLAKYDTDSHSFRFADVINLTHPNPKDARQSDLFKYALDRRRDSSAEIPESLQMLQKRKAILALPLEQKRALLLSENASAELKAAALTWETVGSSFGKGGLDAKAWEAIIPTLGYMALIRNLRNFEEAGVSSSVLDQVASRLANQEEVAKSKQLPFRFLSAHRAVSGTKSSPYGSRYNAYLTAPGSGRFEYPLELALQHSLMNIPSLSGNTLILVDRSGSMFYNQSAKSDMTFADTAGIFGAALAVRANDATLVEFGNSSHEVPFKKNSSILKIVNSLTGMGGTETHKAVKTHWNNKFTRVIIITDEQFTSYQDPTTAVPSNVPVYTFNLAGYKYGHQTSTINRLTFGGLTDQSFALIPMLEAGFSAAWPWEK